MAVGLRGLQVAAHGAFRSTVKIDGVTMVHDEASAKRALEELDRLRDRPHAWDTETVDVAVGGRTRQSPVNHGQVVCATCYCGDDADFGNGPRLFIDNAGPASGTLSHFKGYMEAPDYLKICHNYSFERHMLKHHGIGLRGLHADTLHLARLHDTSLGSWEGLAKHRTQAEKASRAPEEPAREEALACRIRSIRIGSQVQELGTGSVLHIQENSSKAADLPKPGYCLKDLAMEYSLAKERLPNFSELFGMSETAALDAHNSPDIFPEWVRYATTDAVLTFKLFQFLMPLLQARPWACEVHQLSAKAVLKSPQLRQQIADELKQKLIVQGSTKTRSNYGSIQKNTGMMMWDFYQAYLRSMAECLAEMEEVGIGVNQEALVAMESQAKAAAQEHEQAFANILSSVRTPDGEVLNPYADKINIRSSAQMRTLLFGGAVNRKQPTDAVEMHRHFPIGKGSTPIASESGRSKQYPLTSLGLTPSSKRKDFTAGGWPKTSKDILRRLAGDPQSGKAGEAKEQLLQKGWHDEHAETISEALRHLQAAARNKVSLTGFVLPLKQHSAKTGRIHPSWQLDTSTGRLACRSPNLQNLPQVGQDPLKVRAAFQPREGKVFIIADYAQLELKVLAHVTNCETMIKKFHEGGDFHSETALEMFAHIAEAVEKGEVALCEQEAKRLGVPCVRQAFSSERSKAKAVNFGVVYGMSPMSLAEDLGIPKEEAESLMERWFASKPEVRAWIQEVRNFTRHKQRATSLLGRWRTLPLAAREAMPAHQSRSLRAAVNFGIQGSAADIVMAAMLRVWQSKMLKELGFKLVMQVHDELVLEGPEEHAQGALELVREAMENPFKEQQFQLRVPLTVDAVVARSLADKA